MCGQALAHEVLNIVGQFSGWRITLFQHDKGFDDFRAQRIGLANSRANLHGGVAQETIFNLARSDAIAR